MPLTNQHHPHTARHEHTQKDNSIYVVDCKGNHDFNTIQAAIDAAEDGDTIIILPNSCEMSHRYLENIDYLGKAISIQSADPYNPDVAQNTVIDGSITALSTVRIEDVHDGIAQLAGISITGGSGTSVINDSVGGGVYVTSSNGVITHCNLADNYATRGGGLGVTSSSNVQLVNCNISHNVVEIGVEYYPHGAGIFVSGNSNLAMSDCKITNNMSIGDNVSCPQAGGMAVLTPGMLITSNSGSSLVSITNTEISGNTVWGIKDAICHVGGALMVLCWTPSTTLNMTIRNSLLVDNTSGVGAGLVLIGRSLNTTLHGCTIARNMSNDAGGPIDFGELSSLAIDNSIVYANTPTSLEGYYDGPFMGASVEFSYSDAETYDGSVVKGPGNINRDPFFMDMDDEDYHLSPVSPCINSGDPSYVPTPGETDIDSEQRVYNAVVDMGADELHDCNDNGVPDHEDLQNGTSGDVNQNLIPDECECIADLNEDGVTNAVDLGLLLGSWGLNPDTPADLNSDGIVNAVDLAYLLGLWGPCETN